MYVHKGSKRSTYKQVLDTVICDGTVSRTQKQRIEIFRTRHRISCEMHIEVLQELGWSHAEYLAGTNKMIIGEKYKVDIK